MPKHMLRPQGEFPSAGLIRRCAAIFYDFLLSIALLMVITLLYKMAQMAIVGEQQLRQMSDAGALDAVGGLDYLTQLSEAAVTSANTKNYISIIRDKAVMRAMIDIGIVPTATAGRIKCFSESQNIFQSPVTMQLIRTVFDMNSTINFLNPVKSVIPQ